MTDDEKEKVRAVNGCFWLIAEIIIATGIGGFYGWPVGCIVFGTVLLCHVLYNKWRLR